MERCVRVYSEELSRVVQELLITNHYDWFGGLRKAQFLNKGVIWFDDTSKVISYSDLDFALKNGNMISLDEFFQMFSEELIVIDGLAVSINSSYVKIGCTKVDFQTVEKIYNRMLKSNV